MDVTPHGTRGSRTASGASIASFRGEVSVRHGGRSSAFAGRIQFPYPLKNSVL